MLFQSNNGTLGVTQYLFAVDPANDILWYLRVNSSKSLSIVKRKGYFKTVGVFDTPSSKGALIETIDLADMTTGLLNTNYICYNYIDSEKCVYIYTAANNYSDAGSAFNVIKINIQNNSVQCIFNCICITVFFQYGSNRTEQGIKSLFLLDYTD